MGVETILRASRLTATPAMTDDNQLSFNLPSVSRKKVRAAFDGGRPSSDSGVLLLARADRRRALLIRWPAVLPTIAIPRTSATPLLISCAPGSSPLAAAIPIATTSTRCAPIRPSSWPADGCLTAAATCARSRPFRAGRMRRPTRDDPPDLRPGRSLVPSYADRHRSSSWTSTIRPISCTAISNWSLLNAHYDERCFLPIHVYDAATGAAGHRDSAARQDAVWRGDSQAVSAAWSDASACTGPCTRHHHSRRQPLRPRRGDGVVRELRDRLHLRALRQCCARPPGRRRRRRFRVRRAESQAEVRARLRRDRYAAKSWDKERAGRSPDRGQRQPRR